MKIFACTFLVIAGLGVSWAPAAGGPYRELSAEEKAKLDAVLPEKAPAAAAKPRKLLIYDANVGYGGHGSIPFANYAFTQMGERTGTFTTVVSRDPAVFDRQNLKQFDAVCRNTRSATCSPTPCCGRTCSNSCSAAAACWASTERPSPSLIFPRGQGDLARVRADDRRPRRRPPAAGRTRRHQLDSPATAQPPFGGRGFEHTSEFFRVRDPLFARSRPRAPEHRHGQDRAGRPRGRGRASSAPTTTTPWPGRATTVAGELSIRRSATARMTS